MGRGLWVLQQCCSAGLRSSALALPAHFVSIRVLQLGQGGHVECLGGGCEGEADGLQQRGLSTAIGACATSKAALTDQCFRLA